MTPQHREALASMIYGIRERRGFISVTGEVGTGKTTLIYTLLNNLSEKVRTVFIYHTNTTFEQLLKTILLELGVDAGGQQDKLSLLRSLNAYLIHQLDQQSTVAVIIDEAQNLSKDVMEELRMLSNLETCKTKLLQIVLVGQPELEMKLNSPDLRQLKQRIGIRRQIKPLTPKESRKYMEHRLKVVGSSTSRVFTPQAVSMICKYAHGIPRNINVICENTFLIGYSLSKKRISATIVREAISDMSGSLLQPSEQETNNYHLPRLRTITTAAVILIFLGAGVFVANTYVKHRLTEGDPVGNTLSSHAVSGKDNAKTASSGVDNPPAIQTLSGRLGNTTRVLDVVTVNGSNTVSSLAERYYGASNETLMDIILDANPAITDVHRIYKRQQIVIPEISYDSLIIKLPDNTYRLHVGTFSSLQHARSYSYDHNLMGKNVDIFLRKVSENENWYRVIISTYDTKDECMKTLAALKHEGLLPISF